MNGIALLIWLLSFFGYVWFWIEKGNQRHAVAPLIAISAITFTLFIGAAIRLLLPVAILVLMIGLAMSWWMLRARSTSLFHVDILLFAIGCAGLALRYHNALLVQYDDFSHWGMIVRHLLTTNRLPQGGDELITFQSYPPGSALWLYYVCRFLGGSEGVMLAAQAGMTLAGWLALFSLSGEKAPVFKRLISTALMVVGLSLFQGTASLMVDNLVAALAVGALCVCVLQNRYEKQQPLLAGILLAVIALVKDSGLFFAVILVILYALLSFQREKIKHWLTSLVLLCMPMTVSRIIWYANFRLAFSAAGLSRHALTIENMRVMGSDKSLDALLQIGMKIAQEAINPHNIALHALGGFVMIGAVFIILRRLREKRWKWGNEIMVLAVSAGIYTAWLVSLWMMYAFSMSLENANALIAYERYNSTCALFLLGGLAVWTLSNAEHCGHIGVLAVVCMSLVLLTGGWSNGVERLFHETYHVPLRSRMEQLAKQRPVQADEYARVVVDQRDNGMFAYYMARYTFQTNNIQLLSPQDVPWENNGNVYYWASDLHPEEALQTQIIQLMP